MDSQEELKTKLSKAEAWVGIFINKSPKADERRRTPTHAGA